MIEMEKRIGVRLPAADHRRLSSLSLQTGMSTSEVIRALLASAEVVEVKTQTVRVKNKPANASDLAERASTGSTE